MHTKLRALQRSHNRNLRARLGETLACLDCNVRVHGSLDLLLAGVATDEDSRAVRLEVLAAEVGRGRGHRLLHAGADFGRRGRVI